ncbi:hypothetical protein KBC55_03285 [Patescibacteria group bacterium]|nr:hypothetical protein [Patescibacteria group bacterium]
MSSTSYQILSDTVGASGDDTSSSASYQLRDSFGNDASGLGDSASYQGMLGYRSQIYDPVVAFAVYAQDTASQVAAVSATSSSVDVTDASSYAAGDLIAVVQNEGASQITAIGRITSVSVNTLNIDEFTGGAITIDGNNDFVYALSGTTVPLASLTPSTLTTGIVAWEVNVDVTGGYSVYIFEDDDLKNGDGDAITDVSDGAVTLGETEYGARSSDTSLASSTFDTQDTAITSSLQEVGSRASSSFESRDFVTLKAAVSDTALDGSYDHNLTFIFVGNY